VRHHPRKRFGQNFLQDDSVIDAIARAIAPMKGDHVVEIGPGEGALTQALISSGCQLDAIELDRDLRTRLLASFSTYPDFTLHSADALKFDFASLATEQRPLRVVGNLPYNISTPLIFRLLDQAGLIADMHFMLQLEVVDRLAAQPGTKDWGRLGVMAQFQCQVEKLFEVPPGAFYPPPKVQSAVVRLVPHASPQFPEADKTALSRVVTQAFSQRRKTLRNNFRGVLTDVDFEQMSIDPSCRAEALSIPDFVAVAEHLGE
jgi:16S rRNA (adenine1518-N6/adenine1519-N6)-dimethyltransferase